MADTHYRYVEIKRASADGFNERLAEAIAEIEGNGGEVINISMQILPMPNAQGPESLELVRIAQVLVKTTDSEEKFGAW